MAGGFGPSIAAPMVYDVEPQYIESPTLQNMRRGWADEIVIEPIEATGSEGLAIADKGRLDAALRMGDKNHVGIDNLRGSNLKAEEAARRNEALAVAYGTTRMQNERSKLIHKTKDKQIEKGLKALNEAYITRGRMAQGFTNYRKEKMIKDAARSMGLGKDLYN